MNQDQIWSAVRSLLKVFGGFAMAVGWFKSAQQGVAFDSVVTALGGLVTALVPFVLSLTAHTDSAKLAAVAEMSELEKRAAFIGIPDSAKIAAVEAIPQVQKIVVDRTATNGVAAAANDPARPKVVTVDYNQAKPSAAQRL